MIRNSNIRSLASEQQYEDQGNDDWGFIQNVVAPPAPAPAPAPVAPAGDWMSALQAQHPDWVLQAIGGGSGNQETGEMAGPIEGYTFYDPTKTKAGEDKFKRYDASGKLLGEQKFKEPGNAWDLTKQAAADLGPILQFTPLAPFVRAISAMSAAEQGNILGALASGLPLADKIPGLDKATVAALQSAGKYAAVASAAESKDPMQLLNALSQTKEFGGKVPQELKTAGEYVSKAALAKRAAEGDPAAIFKLFQGSAPSGGKGYFPGYDEPGTGEEGFFAPGGEGYVEPEGEDADAYIRSLIGYEEALPKDVTEFLPASEVIRERISLEDRFPPPDDTLNLEDFLPGTGSSTAPGQTIGVTGTLPKNDVIIPDWDFMEEPDRTPGSPTDTTPGTVLPDDDRTSGTAPAGGTKTTGTKTTTKPGMSTEDLMKLLLAMQGQRPEQEEDYRLFAGQPLGYELMYGLRG